MCPYYLDGDLGWKPKGFRPVIPVSLATVQFSRSAKRRRAATAWALAPDADGNAGLSKLNSMRAASATAQSRTAVRPTRSGRHSLGPTHSWRAPRSSRAQAAIHSAIGAHKGSLERR